MPSQVITLALKLNPELLNGIDPSEVVDALSDFRAVLDQISTIIQQHDIAEFDTQGESAGVPWDALSESTLRDKARRGYPEQSLVRTGRLAAEIGSTTVISGNSVTTGINIDEVPYAAYHDQGRGVPQRVLVAVTQDEIDDLERALQRFIEEKLGGNAQAITIEVSAT